MEPVLTVRAYAGPKDHPGMVRVRNSVFDAKGQAGLTVTDFDARYANLRADLVRDCFVVELEQAVLGYARTNTDDLNSAYGQASMILMVDPNAPARRAAVDALVGAALRRTHELNDAKSRTRPTRVVASFRGPDADVSSSLEAEGFRALSREAQLIHRHLDTVRAAPMPDGFELIAIDGTAIGQARAIYEAAQAALADREGAAVLSDMTYEAFRGLPGNDPGLWRAAVAGGEFAAVILAGLDEVEETRPRAGWMEPIAVARGFRGRGLVEPLLTATLVALRDAGATSAALDTHLEEPDQPETMFESLGFELVSITLEYELGPTSGQCA